MQGVEFLYGHRRSVVASSAQEAPVIDGYLDDAVWQQGEWNTGMRLLGKPDELAKQQTFFKISFNDKYFFLAARMMEPFPMKLKIEEFRRDGSIFEDDCFELMLDPYGERSEYYHFIVNAAGIQYDAKHGYEGRFLERNWDCDWISATKIGENEWTMEMAIPLSQLDLKKESTIKWSFNVARQRYVEGKELSTYGPMIKKFHEAQNFNRLVLEGAHLEKFLWSIEGPYNYGIKMDRGNWVLSGRVLVKNLESLSTDFKLFFKQVNQKHSYIASSINGKLNAGEEKDYIFEFPVQKQEPLKLRMEIVDAADELLKVSYEQLALSFTTLDVELIEPSYRKSIYATEVVNNLKIRARIALNAKALKKSRLSVRLVSEKTSEVVKERFVEYLSNDQNLDLPIENLQPGKYKIEVLLFSEDGSQVAKSSIALQKYTPNENEWRIREDGVMMHNGEPFLPIGWFKMWPQEMQQSGGKYNAFIVSRCDVRNVNVAREFLDAMQKGKSHVALLPYPRQEMLWSRKQLSRLLDGDEINQIRKYVAELKDHPALMAWVLGLHPESDNVNKNRLEQVYKIISDEDPYHPCLIVNTSEGGISLYGRVGDIVLPFISIPFYEGKAGSYRSMDTISYYVNYAKRANPKRKGLWVGLQAFERNCFGTCNTRAPSLLELRNMMYQSVLAGAKGFFWFNFKYTHNYPEIRIGVPRLIEEMKELKDVILAADILDAVQIEAENYITLRYAVREVNGVQYLLVINTGSSARKVKFNMLNLLGNPKLQVLSEDRSVQVNEGRFEDYFGPYEVHIYRSKVLDENLPTLAEVSKLIDVENVKRKKIGNLAFEDSGVIVRASSSKRSRFLDRLVDGVYDGFFWSAEDVHNLPQWVELSWPKEIVADKVVIHSSTIGSAELQIKKGNNWENVANFVRQSSGHFQAQFERMPFTQLRVLITGKEPKETSIRLSEIEVFDSKGV